MSRAVEPSSSNAAKYATTNPVVRHLLERFLARVTDIATASTPARVIDLGCGEGLVGERLLQRMPGLTYRGIEMSPTAAQDAKRRLPKAEVVVGDLLKIPVETQWAQLALCLEVLEHLEDPERAVERIAAWSSYAAIISVPFEPWFRLGNLARGKYLSRAGNHPEHLQQFGIESLRSLLSGSFDTVRVEVVFPWLVASCRKSPVSC